jgi:hypothetical protein
MIHRRRHSRLTRQLLSVALFAGLCSCLSAAVADDAKDAKTREVVIQDVRAPELKRYRAMLAGIDEFESRHALAPAATEVRFRLRARASKPDADLEQLKLRIALDDGSIPLPLAADHSFVLPRNAQAERENGELLLNKPKGGYQWAVDVFSPGVPASMRRLGDLRLECRVQVAVIKEEIPFWARMLVNSILLTGDWCGYDKFNIATDTLQPIKAAWLIQGDQRIALPLSDYGHGFMAPIGNMAYPDDTLIELVADGSSPAGAAPASAPD